MRLISVFSIFIVFTCQSVLASETLKVAFGNTLAPWVIPENNTGILIDMVNHSLKPRGYAIEPRYSAYGKRISAYKNGEVNVVSDINPDIIKSEGLDGFFSDIAYAYENIAVTLKSKKLNLNQIRDMNELRVFSWQGAMSALGIEYEKMAMTNPNYKEHPNQELQVKMLFMDRVDVIQLDKHIFSYFRSKVGLKSSINTNVEVDQFPLFGQNRCGFLFRNEKARNAFNIGLAKLRKTGGYDSIFTTYYDNEKH